VKKFVLVCVMFISVSSMLSAEALATWRVQSGSVILESSTNLANPSRGKSAVIAITYEMRPQHNPYFSKTLENMPLVLFDKI
jgi:hypothetical protein